MHIYTTRPFSKTHPLILAMEGTDKERNMLLLVKHMHIHNARPFSKTHLLMLAMEGEDKDYFWSNMHTQTQHKTIQ